MPRSATDATRFTSTTPHASKPAVPASSKSANTPPLRKPGPPGETPQEKVKRLRAAANRARDAEISQFDKLIVRGRVWADRAHRFTALGLIAATFVCGGVTVYALGDMMIHNRRKRAEFFAEQKAIKANAVQQAQLAVEHGTASEDQIEFLNREQEHDRQLVDAAAAKANKRGIFGRSKDWLFSGLKKEEEAEDSRSSAQRLGYEGANGENDSVGRRESDIVRPSEDRKTVISENAKVAFEKEKIRQRTGGPLDRIGTAPENNFEEHEKPNAGGWTSFMVRK